MKVIDDDDDDDDFDDDERTLARGFCVAWCCGGGHVKWCHEVAKSSVGHILAYLFFFPFLFFFFASVFLISFFSLSSSLSLWRSQKQAIGC